MSDGGEIPDSSKESAPSSKQDVGTAVQIVKKRTKRGITQYLVRRVAWNTDNEPDEAFHWEDVEHLECLNLIDEFEKSVAPRRSPDITRGSATLVSSDIIRSLSNSDLQKILNPKVRSPSPNAEEGK